MRAHQKACPECQGPMRIDCARIGRWICLACDYQHDEDPEDESTWLEQWRHAPARETA